MMDYAPRSRHGCSPGVALMPMPALSRAGTTMADDSTREYFAGTDRDRAAFEAGIKLGSIVHQYVGTPLTSATASSLERAIEAATRVQPLVERVRVPIDLKPMPRSSRGRSPSRMTSLPSKWR